MPPGKFACRVCNKFFNSNSNAWKHVKTHGLLTGPVQARTCKHCDKVFKYATLCKLHIKRTCTKVIRKCDKCGLQFKSASQIKDHNMSVNNCVPSCTENILPGVNTDIKLKCDQCEGVFLKTFDLNVHKERFHNLKKYSCNLCDASLSNGRNLNRHIKYVHEVVVRNFPCDICRKTFKDGRTLKNHKKIHDTKNKLHPCNVCEKTFSNKDGLRAHIRNLHERYNKHVCEDCGKGFLNLSSLKRHGEMAHMKGCVYICQECGVEVLGKNRLRNHMQRNHPSNQELATCQYCQKVLFILNRISQILIFIIIIIVII